MKSDPKNPITYFGKTNARESRYRYFGIKEQDRLLHLYVIGRTGTGKSTMLAKRLVESREIFSGVEG